MDQWHLSRVCLSHLSAQGESQDWVEPNDIPQVTDMKTCCLRFEG